LRGQEFTRQDEGMTLRILGFEEGSVFQILEHDGDLNEGETYLFKAIRGENIHALRALLEENDGSCDLNEILQGDPKSALHFTSSRPEMAETLLGVGCDPNGVDVGNGRIPISIPNLGCLSPLFRCLYSTEEKHINKRKTLVAKHLLMGGSDLESQCAQSGFSPIHTAARNNFDETLEAEIEAGADPSVQVPSTLMTPLHMVNDGCNCNLHGDRSSALRIVETLLSAGADSTLQNRMGRTPLEDCSRLTREALLLG
jgi:ankyrin repeat protein